MTEKLTQDDLYSLIEQFEYPFLLLDQDCKPILASTGAATLLELREREDLSQFERFLEPLLRLTKDSLRRPSQLFRVRNFWGAETVSDTKELELQTAGGRPIRVLGYCRHLRCREDWEGGPRYLLVFQDLTYLQPFLASIRQSRRNRALLVMLSCYLGRSLRLDESGDFLMLYQQAEDQLFAIVDDFRHGEARTELQRDTSLAVEIVDSLLHTSSRIRAHVTTSALLAMPRVDFLRMVSHLLLECGDFGGPFAICSLSAKLTHGSLFRSSARDSVELLVVAERLSDIPLHLSPLELYVYRTYVPSQYRVKQARKESEEKSQKTGGTISEQLYSENLAIAAEIAARNNCSLDVSREEAPKLIVKVVMPIAALADS